MIQKVKAELKRRASPHRKKITEKFFRMGPGEYAEGDVFIGVSVPECRRIANQFSEMSFKDHRALLSSKIHEERLVSLLALVEQFKTAEPSRQTEIFDFYLKQAKRVNNWDLVDLSADKIVGRYLLKRGKKKLYQLVQSKILWERRIAVVSTLYFIREGSFQVTLDLSQRLFKEPHDLMHKACGWMLREVGKKDTAVLRGFLNRFCTVMPRTMLRYAIERFPKAEKKKYMEGRVSL